MKTSINLKNPFNYLLFLSITFVVVFSLKSCKDDDNDNNGMKSVAEYSIKMDTKQEIPPVRNRTETGTATLKLYTDSTLSYELKVNGLDASDALTVAHVHVGGPVDAGGPIITLVDNNAKKFNGSNFSGSMKLSKSQYQSIANKSTGFYVNVHSQKFPVGLVRGQLGAEFTLAENIDLAPTGAILRPETGLTILRLTKDSLLYYKVSVNSLTSGDQLTSASINVGNVGITGPVVIQLIDSAVNFDKQDSIKLNASQVEFLMNDNVYVNVTSQQESNSLIRGQVR